LEGEKEWVRRAERGLNEIEKSTAKKDYLKQVRPALDRAAALRDQGRRADAERIWTAVEELYRADPGAADVLKEVARARAK
jgi:hypothetical protein